MEQDENVYTQLNEADASRSIENGSMDDVENVVIIPKPKNSQERKLFDWSVLRNYLGPGLLMSIGYLDPGNLESDLQNGAYASYDLLWVVFGSTMIGLCFQILSARLGVTTGKNLSTQCKQYYSTRVSFFIWFMTQLAIIAADVQEIIGSAIALNMLFKLPLVAGSLITVVNTFLIMLVENNGIHKIELVFTLLIGIMLVCFFVNLFISGFSLSLVVEGLFVPKVPSYGWLQAVGTLGAVLMPHNLFLHSDLVLSRKIDRTDVHSISEANKYNAIESTISLFVAFLINCAILITFAVSFFKLACAENNQANVGGVCMEIGLADAGDSLEKLLGSKAKYIFALGLLSSGFASTITSTMAGSIIVDSFFEFKIVRWKRLIITRCAALIPSLLIAVASNNASSRVDDRVNELLNVFQSIQLPFALIPLLKFTNSEQIMGIEFASTKTLRFVGYFFCALVLIVNAIIMYERIGNFTHSLWLLPILIGVALYSWLVFIISR